MANAEEVGAVFVERMSQEEAHHNAPASVRVVDVDGDDCAVEPVGSCGFRDLVVWPVGRLANPRAWRRDDAWGQ